MSAVLDEILAHKRREVAARKRIRPEARWREIAAAQAPPRGFVQALRRKIAQGLPGLIAELKKASPSRGVIRADFDPAAIARSYQSAGAACLSVLTDERFFQGADAHLQAAREAVSLPVLRKEFLVDPYQIIEARGLGADCILLIAAALDGTELRAFYEMALELGLDVLVEVHDAAELEAALALAPAMIGINNRNLKTFETRLETTFSLLPLVPEGVLAVAESGIRRPSQVRQMMERQVRAFLVGEACMAAPEPGAALRKLFG